MTLTPDEQRLFQIFHPLAAAKEAKIRSDGTRFVYYTSADVATQIIRKREIWMRKLSCMNDFSEVRHGWECLAKAYNESDGGKKLQAVLFWNIFPAGWIPVAGNKIPVIRDEMDEGQALEEPAVA